MSADEVQPSAEGSWRLTVPGDMPFIYRLVAQVDPRWWRFSRHGLEPSQMLNTAQTTAAGVTVVDGLGDPVACALLADAGAAETGTFDYFALADPDAHALARRFAPELIAAAFAGAPLRRIYHERFASDPDLLGEVGSLFEVEVTYPEFAMINGHYEARTTSVITRESFTAWQRAATK